MQKLKQCKTCTKEYTDYCSNEICPTYKKLVKDNFKEFMFKVRITKRQEEIFRKEDLIIKSNCVKCGKEVERRRKGTSPVCPTCKYDYRTRAGRILNNKKKESKPIKPVKGTIEYEEILWTRRADRIERLLLRRG